MNKPHAQLAQRWPAVPKFRRCVDLAPDMSKLALESTHAFLRSAEVLLCPFSDVLQGCQAAHDPFRTGRTLPA